MQEDQSSPAPAACLPPPCFPVTGTLLNTQGNHAHRTCVKAQETLQTVHNKEEVNISLWQINKGYNSTFDRHQSLGGLL